MAAMSRKAGTGLKDVPRIGAMGITILFVTLLSTEISLFAQSGTLQGFLRGDVNGDLVHDLSDPVLLLEELFGAGSGLPCEASADVNLDGNLLLDDVITLLGLIFLGNPVELPAPYPDCGISPIPNGLDCASPPCSI